MRLEAPLSCSNRRKVANSLLLSSNHFPFSPLSPTSQPTYLTMERGCVSPALQSLLVLLLYSSGRRGKARETQPADFSSLVFTRLPTQYNCGERTFAVFFEGCTDLRAIRRSRGAEAGGSRGADESFSSSFCVPFNPFAIALNSPT